MSGRHRSDSAVGEKAITEYVQSCVNFTSNITFTDIDTVQSNYALAHNILLIGTESELKADSVHSLPFYCPVVAEAIRCIGEEKKSSMCVLAQVQKGSEAYSCVHIACIPSKASRTNCPYRPDVITDVVKEVCKNLCASSHDQNTQEPTAEATHKDEKDKHESQRRLDIFIRAPAGAEVAVVNGIARGATRSFSAKSGNASHAYTNVKVPLVNVIFSSRAAFTHESINGRVTTVEDLQILCTSIQLCMRLVDTPTNTLDTIVFAEIAEAYAKQLKCEIEIIKGDALREAGYGGIYGVGQGAQYPPHLVTLRYTNPLVKKSEESEHAHGEESRTRNVALVGKGIVYDCGGLALKPAEHMTNMKTDMGGAAAVFCGFIALVRSIQQHSNSGSNASECPYHNLHHISVTLCLAENAIGPNAFRNDDILVMKSGKTVEVMNTDAEGRIVLGDGVFHATNEQKFVPDVLMDMATLTGAQGIATGERHAAIYVNECDAEHMVLQAGNQCGDTCFPVLYCPEYHKKQYESPHADMRNIMLSRTDAGVSCGGYFVESHLSKKFKGAYVHVDLAFPSSTKAGATGYGVSLITEYFRDSYSATHICHHQ